MANHIYIIDTSQSGNLSSTALAQLVPASVRLPTSSQFPAVTIVNSSLGQPVGISGYAQGYASIVSYDAGSDHFSTNVSQMTIGQIISELNNNSTIYFGSVQINYPTLNLLIANNPTLYTLDTVFSADIQSAMMTDLAILQVTQDSITYAQSVLNLPGVSDALAYYAAQFGLDPKIVMGSYYVDDYLTTMGDKFKQLSSQSATVKNALISAVVGGLTKAKGGLGLFQGFNSWMLYPTNMTGTNGAGNPIQIVTLAGRGNNPGVTNSSLNPINAIAYELSQMVYLTQQSLQFAMATISSIPTAIAGDNVPVIQELNKRAVNALSLIPITPTYTSSPPQTNETVAKATETLQNSYNAYQANPNNPVLADTLNTAIAQYVQANSIQNNITNSVNSAFSRLNTVITPTSNIIVNGSNPFPPLQESVASNSTALSSGNSIANSSGTSTSNTSTSNTSIQSITYGAATTIVSGNVNTVISNSTVPTFVINPTLATIIVTGQDNVALAPITTIDATINLSGSQIYQVLTRPASQANLLTMSSSSGSN